MGSHTQSENSEPEAATSSKRRRKRRFGLALALAGALVEALAIRRRGYGVAGNVVVRCREGHLFTTLWIPGGIAQVGSSRVGQVPALPGGPALEPRGPGGARRLERLRAPISSGAPRRANSLTSHFSDVPHDRSSSGRYRRHYS